MKTWRRGVVGGVCALLGVVAGAAQAGAHPSAWLAAPTESVRAGAAVTVEGREFEVGDVVLHWDSATGPVLATVRGPSFKQNVRVPSDSTAGFHDIVAVQGGLVRMAQVKVKATPAPAPATATPAPEPQPKPATATAIEPKPATARVLEPEPATPAAPTKAVPRNDWNTAPVQPEPVKTAPVETAPVAPVVVPLAVPSAAADAGPARELAPSPAALEYRTAPPQTLSAAASRSLPSGVGGQDQVRLLDRDEGASIAGGVMVLGLGLALLAGGFAVAAVRRHRLAEVPTRR